MRLTRAIVTILAAAAAFILPSVATASASPIVTNTTWASSDAMTPDDTPWN